MNESIKISSTLAKNIVLVLKLLSIAIEADTNTGLGSLENTSELLGLMDSQSENFANNDTYS